MNINLANIDFCPGGKSATLTETTAEILLSETEKVIAPPTGTDGFNKVTITHAPVEESVSATITENGTHTITPSAGFGAMFGVNVDVNVPKSDYAIGGPEWFKDMISRYQSFDRVNYDHQEYMIIDNRKLTIGKCDDNSVPKLDSNGNQITDSNGNIVYEKFIPIYTRDTYSGFSVNIFTDNIPNLPWSSTSYLSTDSTIDIRWPDGNQYAVHPVFFPIATTPLDSTNDFILGANNCIAMLNFSGTGTHNDPIQIVKTSAMNSIDLRSDQGSICNQNGIEFGGWMILTTDGASINYIANDHPILKNKNVTEINLIISSSYVAGYSGFSGIPNFVTNIKSIEMSAPLSQKNMRYMFAELPYLTNIPYLNTEGVTDMSSMFINCSSLTSVPQLDTSKVTDMSGMFNGCRSLTSIPQLDTSKVTDMTTIFNGCTSLISIPLLDTSNVINMGSMFNSCRSLTSIPQLDTSKVRYMDNMFYNCKSLTSIPQLNTSRVELMGAMFAGCITLTSVPRLDATSLTGANDMFGYSWAPPLDKFTTFGGLTNLKINLNLSTCPNLTKESLLNVFNEAADVTASPKTLTLGSTNLAKLTDEEKAIATNKGWVLN